MVSAPIRSDVQDGPQLQGGMGQRLHGLPSLTHALGLFSLLCAAENPMSLGKRPSWTLGRDHPILPCVPKCTSHLESWAQGVCPVTAQPAFPPVVPTDLERGKKAPWLQPGLAGDNGPGLCLPRNSVVPFPIYRRHHRHFPKPARVYNAICHNATDPSLVLFLPIHIARVGDGLPGRVIRKGVTCDHSMPIERANVCFHVKLTNGDFPPLWIPNLPVSPPPSPN